MNILGTSYRISFQVYPQKTLLVFQSYINIQSHEHNITLITCIHLVHTRNMYTFDKCDFLKPASVIGQLLIPSENVFK